MDASITVGPDGQRVAAIISTDVADVLTMAVAFFIADHPDCSSPTKARAYCDELARKLRRRIAMVQTEGTGMQRIVIEGMDS